MSVCVILIVPWWHAEVYIYISFLCFHPSTTPSTVLQHLPCSLQTISSVLSLYTVHINIYTSRPNLRRFKCTLFFIERYSIARIYRIVEYKNSRDRRSSRVDVFLSYLLLVQLAHVLHRVRSPDELIRFPRLCTRAVSDA